MAAVLFTLLIAGIGYRYWPNDERDVRRHLVHLAEALSVPGAESEVNRITRLAVVREYFDPGVQVVADGAALPDREAVMAAIRTWQPPPGGFSVAVVGEQVVLAPDRASAQVALTATLSSRNLQTGAAVMDAREVSLAMAKHSGDWVITRAVLQPASPR